MAYDRIVDVHSIKHSKTVLEDMFKRCGPVTSIIHWKGQHDKPHMIVEYDSISSVNLARSLDRPDLQVIRASNNEGLIRKFKELTRTKSPPRIQQPSKGSRNRSLSPLPAIRTRRSRRLPPRGLESRWKNDRYYSSESEPESRRGSIPVKKSVPVSVTTSLKTQVESGSKSKDNPPVHQVTNSLAVNKEDSVRSKIDIPKVPPILRIPYVGEIIELELNQLEENPVGIIIMLTAAEAPQQLWMIVAAHYNSKQNVESARKVLEAGIDFSIRLGRTDTKPFWYLLDQINSKKQDYGGNGYAKRFFPQGTSSNQPVGKVVSSNKEYSGSVRSFKPVLLIRLELFVLDHNLISETKEKTLSGQLASRSSLRPPDGPRNSISPVKKNISPTTQSQQLNKLQEENKALRSKLASAMDDLSEARIGKRRAEEEMKEERTVRRKLENDLKHSEDSLRRSKRMEETALEHIKREVESRRKTEALLANNEKTQQQQQQQQQQPQQDLLSQIKSLLQNVSRRDAGSTV